MDKELKKTFRVFALFAILSAYSICLMAMLDPRPAMASPILEPTYELNPLPPSKDLSDSRRILYMDFQLDSASNESKLKALRNINTWASKNKPKVINIETITETVALGGHGTSHQVGYRVWYISK